MRAYHYSAARVQLPRRDPVPNPPMREVAARCGIAVDAHGRCLCPFHDDHTPSMQLYNGTRGWYCWVCGEGGDAVDFIRKLYGLSFPDAVARLRSEFDLQQPEPVKRKSDEERQKIEIWHNCRELVLFLQELIPSPANGGWIGQAMAQQEYLEYLLGRG